MELSIFGNVYNRSGYLSLVGEAAIHLAERNGYRQLTGEPFWMRSNFRGGRKAYSEEEVIKKFKNISTIKDCICGPHIKIENQYTRAAIFQRLCNRATVLSLEKWFDNVDGTLEEVMLLILWADATGRKI